MQEERLGYEYQAGHAQVTGRRDDLVTLKEDSRPYGQDDTGKDQAGRIGTAWQLPGRRYVEPGCSARRDLLEKQHQAGEQQEREHKPRAQKCYRASLIFDLDGKRLK